MKQNNKGFTLIELLVVIAIIGLLSSVVLVALNNARIKSRDAKRIGDMSQMQKALELYYNSYRGYPVATGTTPALTASEIARAPVAPTPADGTCNTLTNPSGQPANDYHYVPTGTTSVVEGQTVYPSYNYYFCIGRDVGSYSAGRKTLTPKGVESY